MNIVMMKFIQNMSIIMSGKIAIIYELLFTYLRHFRLCLLSTNVYISFDGPFNDTCYF